MKTIILYIEEATQEEVCTLQDVIKSKFSDVIIINKKIEFMTKEDLSVLRDVINNKLEEWICAI